MPCSWLNFTFILHFIHNVRNRNVIVQTARNSTQHHMTQQTAHQSYVLLLDAACRSTLTVALAPLFLCQTVTRHCCYFSGNPRPGFDLRIKRMSLLIASREEWWCGGREGGREGGVCWTGELQIPEPKFSTLVHSGVLNLSLLFWVVLPLSLYPPTPLQAETSDNFSAPMTTVSTV